MKPTPQVSIQQRSTRSDRITHPRGAFPKTDCSYQLTAEAVEASSAMAEQELSEMRTFRTISREFFGGEADREYIKEAFFFGCVVAVAAWPVTVMIHQLITMMISSPVW